MPPGGERRGGGGHVRTKPDHPPAAVAATRTLRHVLRRPFPHIVRRKKKQQEAAKSLPEGPLGEILSRVPYKSLCRFKCVSTQWLALCSSPDILKRSPQTLAGFFHNHLNRANDLKFHNLSGRGPPMVDPSLPFLHDAYERVKVEQCSSSLLLCMCWKTHVDEKERKCADLVVCNPATKKWIVLPQIVFPDEDGDPVRFKPLDAFLGFDAAVPSRFVVFVPLVGCLDNVAIYSSETQRWIQSTLDDEEDIPVVTAECVFLNGLMHLMIEEDAIAAVDTQRESCNRIALPDGMEPSNSKTSMGQSQGLLHAWYIDRDEDYQLSVWVLHDYNSERWTLKHTVDLPELFDAEDEKRDYEMFAIHPERNLIFITDWEDTTLSYDMDSRKVQVMCTNGDFLGGLPFTPCFADTSLLC